jgi:hypothetical protein
METTIITLLTIAVILLSIVIIALLAAVVMVVVKVNRIAKSLDDITSNVASATAWLSPMKLFSEAAKIFRKK